MPSKLRSKSEYCFVIVVAIEVFVGGGINGLLAYLLTPHASLGHESSALNRGLVTGLALAVPGYASIGVIGYNALAQRNLRTAWALYLYNILLFVHSVFLLRSVKHWPIARVSASNVNIMWGEVVTLIIANVMILPLCATALLAINAELNKQWRWDIVQITTTDPKVRRFYQVYRVLITLIRFDYLFATGTLLASLVASRAQEDGNSNMTISIIGTCIPMVLSSLERGEKTNIAFSLIMISLGFLSLACSWYFWELGDLRGSIEAYPLLKISIAFWIVVAAVNTVAVATLGSIYLVSVDFEWDRYFRGLDKKEPDLKVASTVGTGTKAPPLQEFNDSTAQKI